MTGDNVGESVGPQIRNSSFIQNRSSGGNVESSNRPERYDENLERTFYDDQRNSTLMHMNTVLPVFNPSSNLNISDHIHSSNGVFAGIEIENSKFSNVSTPSPFFTNIT